MRTLPLLLSFLLLLLLGACGKPQTGAVEPHWDRDTCERCRMVLSDRFHSAQVRYRDDSGRSRVRLFDDIGCAIVWLQDQPWRDAPTTEIWVNDHRSGEWIDARKAFYVSGHNTSMEYGLGAQSDAATGGMDFAAARRHVLEKERRNHARHGPKPR